MISIQIYKDDDGVAGDLVRWLCDIRPSACWRFKEDGDVITIQQVEDCDECK